MESLKDQKELDEYRRQKAKLYLEEYITSTCGEINKMFELLDKVRVLWEYQNAEVKL